MLQSAASPFRSTRPRAMAALFCLALAALPLCGCNGESRANPGPSFAYSGDIGPGFWSELSLQWTDCGSLVDQSPVDLTGGIQDLTLGPLDLALNPTPIHLINNGHTIEQEYAAVSTLTIGADVFELLQFHFHTFSEHAVDGVQSVMEMHAVFHEPVTGNLAVVGVLYDIGMIDNPFLADLLGAGLPEMEGAVVTSLATTDLTLGLPDTANYFRYDGSLTTPPCSAIVTWTVLKVHDSMTQAQFDEFRRILGNNFRPVRPIAGRVISET